MQRNYHLLGLLYVVCKGSPQKTLAFAKNTISMYHIANSYLLCSQLSPQKPLWTLLVPSISLLHLCFGLLFPRDSQFVQFPSYFHLSKLYFQPRHIQKYFCIGKGSLNQISGASSSVSPFYQCLGALLEAAKNSIVESYQIHNWCFFLSMSPVTAGYHIILSCS